MKLFKLSVIALAVFFPSSASLQANIIEQGDLNIIDQTGNASDGLRFLDMTYSTGKTAADALADAQAVYADARLATSGELDDLFQAANVTYSGSATASDAFGVGANIVVADSGSGATVVADTLGETLGAFLSAWTLPDGSSASTSTRDVLEIASSNHPFVSGNVSSYHTTAEPANILFGWFIVSEASSASVPEPSSLAMLGLIGCAGIFRRRRRDFAA